MKKDIEITIDEMEAANHLHKTHGWALKEENVYNQEKDSVFFVYIYWFYRIRELANLDNFLLCGFQGFARISDFFQCRYQPVFRDDVLIFSFQ